ncbi:acyl-CoA thioesterase [Marinobacter fonticola]|uniref:acyl-CoA thioesterase n=1 Tax=Marinobacter fonticola TaxID=2603215 RepID=UPI0011E7396D|nr:thioesterase family protein [Marinobacter fonticola]
MTGSSSMHPLDQATALENLDGSSLRGQFPYAYANMVGPYGGVIAATLLNAVLTHPERQGEPVAMTVNFAAPMAEAAYAVVPKVSRTNRSTQHWTLELCQDEAVVATATVFLAVRRDSWTGADTAMPEVPSPSHIEPLDTRGYMAWVQNYQMRMVQGGFDPSGQTGEQDNALTRMWVRDHPPRPLDFLSLMAISDSFFPRVFIRRQQRMPAGTVSMTTYFHADSEMLRRQGDRDILAEARGGRYYRNYYDQDAELWSSDGDLLATTHQIAYFKG